MSVQDAIVYVIDDDPAMLDSLSWVIESFGIKVKTYICAQDFIDNYNADQHSCILLDVRMKGISGPELQLRLNELGTHTPPIIFISGYEDIPLVVRIMQAGAIDFLTKPFNNQILLETINKALRIDKTNREKILSNLKAQEKFSSLSTREMQILKGICAGKRNKIISNELSISLKTVEAHRAAVMKKLKVKSVSELIKMSMTHSMENEPIELPAKI